MVLWFLDSIYRFWILHVIDFRGWIVWIWGFGFYRFRILHVVDFGVLVVWIWWFGIF